MDANPSAEQGRPTMPSHPKRMEDGESDDDARLVRLNTDGVNNALLPAEANETPPVTLDALADTLQSSFTNRYSPATIEPKWQRYWENNKTFASTEPQPGEKKFYCLDMFPYPSGAGLHVGHPVGYVASDIITRAKRMQGYKVLHPMGWDAFGLPAEQHAIKTGRAPAITTQDNIRNYKRQMTLMGLSYDWDRAISTANPGYFKWTQHIFVRLYESFFDSSTQKARPIQELPIPSEVTRSGAEAVEEYRSRHRLVYYSDIPVNWCPALGTVLANEEVFNGKSEAGHPVFRKPMRQLVMRISAYADRLLQGLDELDWPEGIKDQQRRWIGRQEGMEVTFQGSGCDLHVFTASVELLPHVTFLAIAPEYPALAQIVSPQHRADVECYVESAINRSDRARISTKSNTGVFTGSYFLNPISGSAIPLYVADYVLPSHGSGIVMGIPEHEQHDLEFAIRVGLRISQGGRISGETILRPEGAVIDADSQAEASLTIRPDIEAGRTEISKYLEDGGLGRTKTHYELRDWVFSRQRYWGKPIPLVHWEDGSIESLPLEQLPLELPKLDNYRPSGDGESALARADDWLKIVDPITGKIGRRETLTMPQWAGSCWYPLRYMDPHNNAQIADLEKQMAWGPVDLYIGGAEHAVLHLLYARFWFHAMNDLGITPIQEPFKKLFNQGMLISHAFQTKDGVKVSVDEVIEQDAGTFVHHPTGKPVTRITAKMSKSLRNVVSPDTVIEQFGADALRVHLMFMGPVEGPRLWNTQSVSGAYRFLRRVHDFALHSLHSGSDTSAQPSAELEAVKNRIDDAVIKVTSDIESLKLNTAIAELMKCLNDIESSAISSDSLETFIKLVSPFAPHLSEELWEKLGHKESMAYAQWPFTDGRSKFVTQSIDILLQVNGKKHGMLTVPSDCNDKELRNCAIEGVRSLKGDISHDASVFIVRDRTSGVPRLVNIVLS